MMELEEELGPCVTLELNDLLPARSVGWKIAHTLHFVSLCNSRRGASKLPTPNHTLFATKAPGELPTVFRKPWFTRLSRL